MKSPRVLLAAALAAFVLGLVSRFPADAALRWLAPDTVRAMGVAGTVWNGSAAGIDVGSLRLGETTWQVSAMALLVGRLGAHLETRIGDGTASGRLGVGLGGTITCNDCRYEGPVAALRPVLPALGALDGRLEVNLAAVRIEDGWPAVLVGQALVSGVPFAMPGAAPSPAAPRASFTASVAANPVPEGGVIEVAVQDAGGPVELSARLTLTPPGNFDLAGNAKARADAPPEIVNALSAIGRKGADGATELGIAGTF